MNAEKLLEPFWRKIYFTAILHLKSSYGSQKYIEWINAEISGENYTAEIRLFWKN